MQATVFQNGLVAGCIALASSLMLCSWAQAESPQSELPNTCTEPEGMPVVRQARAPAAGNPFAPSYYASWMYQRNRQLSYQQWMLASQQQWARVLAMAQSAAIGAPDGTSADHGAGPTRDRLPPSHGAAWSRSAAASERGSGINAPHSYSGPIGGDFAKHAVDADDRAGVGKYPCLVGPKQRDTGRQRCR